MNRTRPRISPRDFEDYSVQMLIGEEFYSGPLGNISEIGLCIVVPGQVEMPEQAVVERGSIHGRYLEHPIQFAGKIVWSAPSEALGEPATAAGVEFSSYTDLPEALLALSVATED